MSPPIVSFIGRSNSGKTTFLEKLIAFLVGRGHRVGTVKHHFHGDFAIDHEGKDSWRHSRAGAVSVALSSPLRLAIISRMDGELPIEDIVQRFPNPVDIVLTEGYKLGPWPKIEVNRAALGQPLLAGPEDNLIAVVADRVFDVGVPRFGLDDAAGVAELLERHFSIAPPTEATGRAGPGRALAGRA